MVSYIRSLLHYFSDRTRSTNMVFSILYGIFGLALALVFARDMTSSSSFQSAADISLTNNSEFANQTLNYHNWFRNQHNASALTWNTSIAEDAEKWAMGCDFRHSQAGQNLVAGFPDVASSIDAWGLERTDYNWNAPGFGEDTGHFTQMVWKGTKQVGCGRWLCPAGTIFPNFDVWYLVCNYADAGNVVGGRDNNEFFVENVGRQVEGFSDMGIVSMLSSTKPEDTSSGGLVTISRELLVSAIKLQYRALEFANHVRGEASVLLTALAGKMF